MTHMTHARQQQGGRAARVGHGTHDTRRTPGGALLAARRHAEGGGRADAKGQRLRSVRKQNFFWYSSAMFQSLPYEPRRIQATEARLERIYAAAKRGLKGESLALSAGLLPQEFNQIAQLDPLVNLAAQKGRADAEMELSDVLHAAALSGDAKMALEILKHQHGWVAKQQIEVDQRISITAALAMAQQRVTDANDDLFSGGRTSTHGEVVDARVIE